MNGYSASRNNFSLGKYAPGRIIEKTFNNTPRGGVFLGGLIYEKLRYFSFSINLVKFLVKYAIFSSNLSKKSASGIHINFPILPVAFNKLRNISKIKKLAC